MAIATIYRSSLSASPSITQTALYDAIKAALIQAGLTFFSEYTASGTRHAILTDTAGSGTYSTVYYRFSVTSALVITHQLFTAWNTGTNTGSNGSGDVHSTTFVTGSDIAIVALNGGNNSTEFSLVALLQGSTFQLLGVLMPENSFDIWTLNRAPKACISQTSIGSAWSLAGINIFSNTNLTADPVGNSLLSAFCTEFNTYAPEKGIKLRTNTGQGCWLWTSSNFAVVPGNSIPRLSIFTEPGTAKNFMMLGTGNGALAVEVANA